MADIDEGSAGRELARDAAGVPELRQLVLRSCSTALAERRGADGAANCTFLSPPFSSQSNLVTGRRVFSSWYVTQAGITPTERDAFLLVVYQYFSRRVVVQFNYFRACVCHGHEHVLMCACFHVCVKRVRS